MEEAARSAGLRCWKKSRRRQLQQTGCADAAPLRKLQGAWCETKCGMCIILFPPVMTGTVRAFPKLCPVHTFTFPQGLEAAHNYCVRRLNGLLLTYCSFPSDCCVKIALSVKISPIRRTREPGFRKRAETDFIDSFRATVTRIDCVNILSSHAGSSRNHSVRIT